MLFYYLRVFNHIFALSGLKKPFILKSEKVSNVTLLDRLWTLIILALIVTWYCFVVRKPVLCDIKNNMDLICEINEYIVGVLTVLAYLLQPQAVYTTLYSTINGVIKRFKVEDHTLKKFCLKIYLQSLFPFVLFISLGIWSLFSTNASHLMFVRIPLFIENFHLLLHICIVLALLKTLNGKVATKLNLSKNNYFNAENKSNQSVFALVLQPGLSCVVNQIGEEYFETKYFSQVYDDLSNCIKLLEKQHGVQILLDVWMVFLSGVIQFTLMASEKSASPFFIALRLITPLMWYTILGYFDDQIRQEVELTDILIMKNLIDFRCDRNSRQLLTTFKQLVSTHRLRFRACGLLHINYAMVLGTIVSILTYSIIMIQLFMDD